MFCMYILIVHYKSVALFLRYVFDSEIKASLFAVHLIIPAVACLHIAQIWPWEALLLPVLITMVAVGGTLVGQVGSSQLQMSYGPVKKHGNNVHGADYQRWKEQDKRPTPYAVKAATDQRGDLQQKHSAPMSAMETLYTGVCNGNTVNWCLQWKHCILVSAMETLYTGVCNGNTVNWCLQWKHCKLMTAIETLYTGVCNGNTVNWCLQWKHCILVSAMETLYTGVCNGNTVYWCLQ